MFRAGDAMALGDPFMGEGIGRALGAGPMIAAAFQAREGRAHAATDRYQKAWRRHYGPRLWVGSLLRGALGTKALFPPLSALLAGNVPGLSGLAALAHRGTEGPGRLPKIV
jgi:flavin-dependent dehydrogenase